MRLAGMLLVLCAVGASVLSSVIIYYIPVLYEMSYPVIFGAGLLLTGVFLSIGVFVIGGRLDQVISSLSTNVSEGLEPDLPLRRTSHLLRHLFPALGPFQERIIHQSEKIDSLQNQVREYEVRQRITETERRELYDIMDSLKDAVLVTDSFNELVLANQAAMRIFNFDVEEKSSSPIDQVVSDEDVVRNIKSTWEGANISTRRHVEHALQMDDRESVYDMTFGCLADNRNRPSGVVTIAHDITKEKEISQMKNDFVAQASHELRTPLSSIRGYIEMLLDGEAGDESTRREFYESIQNEANRLNRLVDNMLNISRIEAGLIQAHWETVDLSTLAEEVASVTRTQATAKEQQLTTRHDQLCYQVEGDRDLLFQVIMNLVSNAIKYSPEGSRITVNVDLADCNRSVLVSVNDTGLGIPEESIPKLFDKFYRVGSFSRVAKGTGLGLSLVKQIVEGVHRGEIGVESEMGMGSRFWFSIPCHQSE